MKTTTITQAQFVSGEARPRIPKSPHTKRAALLVVYKTDDWHSFASRDLIAVCATWGHVNRLLKVKCRQEGHRYTAEQQWNIENIGQTQGYKGEGEFHIDTIEINTLV